MKNNLILFIVLISVFIMLNTGFAQSPLMNELYSRGITENPDWIEIYNPTSNQVDLTGFKIYDNGGQAGTKPKKEFPSGSIIPAHGFFVIVTDDTSESGFGLSSGGEEVWFEDASGVVIDNIVFPAMDVTQSFGRYPNGSTNLQLLNTITRGSSNVLIQMNEIYSRGTDLDPDWIELFNSSSSDIDITGYKIYDNAGQTGTKPKKEFPAGSVVPANGFLVIATDDTSASGFGLSSGGEEVWFEDASGAVIDNVVFPAMDITQSFGRYPDSSPNWQLLNVITKGAPNSVTTIDNESIDLNGFTLSQNYPNPFNPSTTINYYLPTQSYVKIEVYNLIGELLKVLVDQNQSSGNHSVQFQTQDLASGIYFYSITASVLDGSQIFNSIRKMMLVK